MGSTASGPTTNPRASEEPSKAPKGCVHGDADCASVGDLCSASTLTLGGGFAHTKPYADAEHTLHGVRFRHH